MALIYIVTGLQLTFYTCERTRSTLLSAFQVTSKTRRHAFKVVRRRRSQGWLPYAQVNTAGGEHEPVGQTLAIESIKANIMARTESLISQRLTGEGFGQLSESSSSPVNSRCFSRTWSKSRPKRDIYQPKKI